MGFNLFDYFQTDRWDPDNDGPVNRTYALDGNGQFVASDAGSYYRYSPVASTNIEYYNKVNPIYWNSEDGTVYYDAGDGKYTKLEDLYDDKGKLIDTSPGLTHFAEDAQLDQIASKILSIQNQKQVDAVNAQKEAKETAADNATGTLGEIKVNETAEGSATTEAKSKYNKKLKEAELRLQNLIAESDAADDSYTNTTTESEPVYYKYGQNEIDLKYYLHNLGTNLQNYLNSQDWSKAQKDAFRKSYETYKAGLTSQLTDKTSRFSTDDSGILIDAQGLLDGANDHIFIDKNGNTYNSLDEITDKKLRKTAIEFSPNDEVANYFNTVGQTIVGAGKVKNSPEAAADSTFDLNKNGFINYWVGKINPAGGTPDIDPYLDLDPVGLDGKRKRTNRTKYLVHELNNYIKDINKGKYNFEGTFFKTKENYITKIQQAINNLNNGWDSSDPASLQAIGITPDFYQAFMSDKADPLASTEEEAAAKAEAEAKNKANAASDFIQKSETRFNTYAAKDTHWVITKTHNNPLKINVTSGVNATQEGWEVRAAGQFNSKFGYHIDANSPTVKTSINAVLKNLWDVASDALRQGSAEIQTPRGVTKLADVLSTIIPILITNGTFNQEEDGTYILDDPDNDYVNGAILCYNAGRLYYDWIGNHRTCSAWIKFHKSFEDQYNTQSSTTDNPKYSFKEGGSIPKFAAGGQPSVDIANMSPEELQAYMAQLQASEETPTETAAEAQPVQEKRYYAHRDIGQEFADSITNGLFAKRETAAQSKGMSYEQYNRKQRTLNGTPDVYNADNGIWKTEDKVRLGAIAADIVSLVLDPVSGSVANVGSTAANFMADWLDNSVTATEMWKNLGMNLGMDALSIIPIVGDAAGTGGKLLKSVKTFAPKIMYALSAYGMLGTLKNMPNIMESLQKVTSDEKLTVGDWQNIAQAITAIAGVNNGVKSGVAKRLAKNKAKTDDAIGLGLKKKKADGELGATQDFIFRGKHGKELKKLVSEGKVDDINNYLKNLEGFSEYEVNTNLKANPISVSSPIGRRTGEDGKKHWGVHSPFSVARKIDAFEIFDKSKLREGYASKTRLNTGRQDAVQDVYHFGDDDLFTKAEVDAIQKQQVEALTAEAKAATEKRKKRIETLQNRLNGLKDESGTQIVKGINQDILEATANLDAAKQARANKKAELTAWEAKNYGQKTRTIGKKVFDLSDSAKTQAQKKDWIAEKNKFEENVAHCNENIKDLEEKLSKATKESDRDALQTQINAEKAERDSNQKALDYRNSVLDELAEWEKANSELSNRSNILKGLKKNEFAYARQLANYNAELAKLKRLLDANDPSSLLNAVSHSKQKLLDSLGDNPFIVTYGNGRTREVKNPKQIIEDMHLMRKGGRLSFLYKGGKAASGVQLKPSAKTWYEDVFSGYKDEILKRILANRDYYKTINDMQTQHHKIYTEAGGNSGTWRTTSYQGKNNSVGNYQTRYKGEGFNALGIAKNFDQRYGYEPNSKRTSGDNNKGGNFTVDNYYSSITDDRRVLGRRGDWSTSQIQDFNNALKQHKLEMYLGDGDYYYIRELGQNTPDASTPQTPASQDLNELDLTEGRAGGENDPDKKKTTKETLSNALKEIGKGLPHPVSLLRYKLLDNINRRMAENKIKAEVPFLQDPLVDYKLTHSSLLDESEGSKQKADTVRHGSHAITSDGQLQMNYLKELNETGTAQKDAKDQVSTAIYRKKQEEELAQRQVNHKSEHDTAAQNTLSEIQTAQNKNDYWNSYLSQHGTTRDTLLQEIEYNYKTQKAKKEALEESARLSELSSAVSNNPNNYGANLTPAELAIYNKRNAISTSAMSDTEITNYSKALEKVQNAIKRQQYVYYGIPASIYTEDAFTTSPTKQSATITLSQPDGVKSSKTGGILAKDGTKLATAKLRARAKNADRFQKSVEKKIDNMNKKLDRISKSMYGLPKVSVLK